MDEKKWKILALILLLITILTVTVSAIALYTLRIPLEFSVNAVYGLRLEDVGGSEITSLYYGSFNRGQGKYIRCYLKNTGNTAENATWHMEDLDTTAWRFEIHWEWLSWEENTTITINRGERSPAMFCWLYEVNADPTISYTATLVFEVI